MTNRWTPWVAAALAATLGTAAAPAQGVFDMGALTGTLSTDAVTQAEEKRSRTGRYAAPTRQKARTRSAAENCALRPAFKRRFGANHPDSIRFDAMCRALGY